MSTFWRRFFRHNAPFLIRQLEALIPGPPIGGTIVFRTEGAAQMGEITVRDDETTLRATVTLLDAEGHPTEADSPPRWEVENEDVATVTPADDGLTATFDVGAPGATAVTVTATETGDGTGDPTELVFTGLITVTPGDAVSGSVEFTTG